MSKSPIQKQIDTSKQEQVILLGGRLNGKQRNRLKRLLNMLYKPSELAEELGISMDQIYRVYLPLGCPHQRDGRRYVTINGEDFKEWYLLKYKKATIEDDETFCKTCRKAVKIQNPVCKQKDGLTYVLSTCPNCGRKLTKITGCQKGEQ